MCNSQLLLTFYCGLCYIFIGQARHAYCRVILSFHVYDLVRFRVVEFSKPGELYPWSLPDLIDSVFLLSKQIFIFSYSCDGTFESVGTVIFTILVTCPFLLIP